VPGDYKRIKRLASTAHNLPVLEGAGARLVLMIFASWSWRSWVLFVLAAVAVAAYFGVLPAVEQALEPPTVPEVVAKLAAQPKVAQSFSEPLYGRMDAWMLIFLFVFVSPLALLMAVTIGIFLLSALAGAFAPLLGGEKIAMLVMEIGSIVAVFMTRDSWLPPLMYFLGLVARAYVVIAA